MMGYQRREDMTSRRRDNSDDIVRARIVDVITP